jgi:hypothetical protein
MIKVKGSDGRYYSFKFKKGDIVRIDGRGHTYPYYTRAMQELNVSCDYLDNHLSLEQLKQMNWVITNFVISIHRNYIRHIYSIKNSHGKFLVIDEKGIVEKREIPSINIDGYAMKNNEDISVWKEAL